MGCRRYCQLVAKVFQKEKKKITEADFNFWFEGAEETEQMMSDEEIFEKVQEGERLVGILEPSIRLLSKKSMCLF